MHIRAKCAGGAYPRGRGGACSWCGAPYRVAGLSPRTRGSPRVGGRRPVARGPIPADSGEPPRSRSRPCRNTAYPRGRGGALMLKEVAPHGEGLSPRTRGSQTRRESHFWELGPIPADAGEPWDRARGFRTSRAYPRGRGGAALRSQVDLFMEGLSPRTRGSHVARQPPVMKLGPIPADAGEPGLGGCVCIPGGAYPRGRGGASLASSPRQEDQGLSPRTRGSPGHNAICTA